MRRNSSPFKWRHYTPDVILLCVRWYCRYSLGYRALEETMRERGLTVGHGTVFGFGWEGVCNVNCNEGYERDVPFSAGAGPGSPGSAC